MPPGTGRVCETGFQRFYGVDVVHGEYVVIAPVRVTTLTIDDP